MAYVLDSTGRREGSGTISGTGVSAVEELVDGTLRKTVFTFTNTPIPLTDNAGVVAYGSLKIIDLPEGNTLFLGATANLTLGKTTAGVNDTWDGDFGVGTAAAGNDATLATTEQNIIPTTATPQAVSGATTAKGVSTSTAVVDGTATASDVYLNFLVDDADHDVTTTPCSLVVNGTLTVVWMNLGDK